MIVGFFFEESVLQIEDDCVDIEYEGMLEREETEAYFVELERNLYLSRVRGYVISG